MKSKIKKIHSFCVASPPFHVSRFTFHVAGFTLIELMVVIGITVILSTVVFFNLIGYESRRDLELTGKRVAALFRDAQSRSVTQESGRAWMVNISGSQFQLFQRDASACGFIAGSQSGTVNAGVRFSQSITPSAFANNICFEAITGSLKPYPGPIIGPVIIKISLTGAPDATVTIYDNGRIE